MNAPQAREQLEAVIWRHWPGGPGAGKAVDAILAAADAYRHAPVPFLRADMHLEGTEGGYAACRYGLVPPAGQVTGNPVLVTCGNCLRSRLYRDMTAEGRDAAA